MLRPILFHFWQEAKLEVGFGLVAALTEHGELGGGGSAAYERGRAIRVGNRDKPSAP